MADLRDEINRIRREIEQARNALHEKEEARRRMDAEIGQIQERIRQHERGLEEMQQKAQSIR